MELSSLFVRITFLCFPGIVGALLYWTLVHWPKRRLWQDFAIVIMLTLSVYSLTGAVDSILVSLGYVGYPFSLRFDLNEFLKEKGDIPWLAILFNAGIASLLVFVLAYLRIRRLFFRFAYFIGCSKRDGAMDVWEAFHENSDFTVWVNVRDFEHGLVYKGYISDWSDPCTTRELIVREVEVFSLSNGNRLYETDFMYLAFKDGAVAIEAIQKQEEKPIAKDDNALLEGQAEKSAYGTP